MRMAEGRVVAYSRAKASMASAATAGGLGRALRRPVAHVLAQLRSAHGVALEVVAVLEPVAEDDVHHAQRQGRVGARQERQVLVALLGRARAGLGRP